MSKRALLGIGMVLMGSGGCTHPTNMVTGVPLEVEPGYCIVKTQYKQRGKTLDRDSVMKRLSKNNYARPHLESGSNLAVGAIVMALLGTAGIIFGAAGKRGEIRMEDSASTTLLAGGIVLGAASWPLCLASDRQYAAGVNAYNLHLPQTTDDDEDDASE